MSLASNIINPINIFLSLVLVAKNLLKTNFSPPETYKFTELNLGQLWSGNEMKSWLLQ